MSKYDFDKFKKRFRRVHNLQVNQLLKSTKETATKAKINLLNDCLIDNNDTAQLMLLKSQMLWFNLGLANDRITSVASFPVSWVLKPGDNIPQLAIVYKLRERKTGYNTIYIPHYNGQRTPSFPPFKKGIYGTILELKDNSKIIIFTSSHEAGKSYISKNLLPFVKREYRSSNYKHMIRSNIASGTTQVVRCDYYPRGKTIGSIPTWRHYP